MKVLITACFEFLAVEQHDNSITLPIKAEDTVPSENKLLIKLISFYENKGCDVFLCADSSFAVIGASLTGSYDFFDFQLSRTVPLWIISALKSRGKHVYGCVNPLCADKFQFAKLLKRNPLSALSVPSQAVFYNHAQLASFPFEEHFHGTEGEFFIAKSLFSAGSNFPDGSEYLIFQKDGFPVFVEEAAQHPLWWSSLKRFCSGRGILISKLILTQDIYSGNENCVVHKILLPAGLTRKKFARWPLLCQKMIGHYELPVLGRNFIPISKVFTLKRWEHGNVESYRGLLWQLIEAVSIGPCLICVDAMITEKGTPYFLEVNRLAGNFLIHFEGQQRNVFENYLHLTF